MDILDANPNPFGGIVVNPGGLTDEARRFRLLLADSVMSGGRWDIRWRGWRFL